MGTSKTKPSATTAPTTNATAATKAASARKPAPAAKTKATNKKPTSNKPTSNKPTKNKPTKNKPTKNKPTSRNAASTKTAPALAATTKSKPSAHTASATTANPANTLKHKLVRATAALKKDFAKLQASVRKLRGQGTVSFDALYELVGQILASDPPLYVGGGYKTKEDFIAAELPGETLRSVQRNVLVARCFSPGEEATHGIAFLEEVALYAKELTAAAEPPPAIDLDKLTITVPGKGGATTRKKASTATIDDVRQARRALRQGGATRRDASPAEAALRAALGEYKVLATVTVRASRDSTSFGNVPIAELAAFSKAIGKTKLPHAEKPPAPRAKKR